MIDQELELEILKKTLARGGDYADVFIEARKTTAFVLEESRVERVVAGAERGAGIRLLLGGKTSYASCNDLSKEALLRAAAQAGSAAAGVGGVTIRALSTRESAQHYTIDLLPGSVPLEQKIALAVKADRVARTVDPRISQVTVAYRDTVQKVQIASSDGYRAEDERIYTLLTIHVVAAADGIVQTGYESAGAFAGFELFDREDVEELSLRAAGRAVSMLGARRAPAGRMPVVISSRAGGTMIHEAIGHGLEADLSRQGLSVFTGKMGRQIAADCITVIDDSTLSGRRGSFRFDDEGTPAQRTVLVERGVLKSYMYDKLTAMKDNVRSTGNGRRESFESRPIPRMTNTFIAPGTDDPDAIIRSVNEGLLVCKMGGGQVNTVTGDFVFDVQEGYMIRQGMQCELVRGATLAGNGPEILKAIDMVGSDLGFAIGTCGKDAQGVPVTDAMPTVRIPEIIVGGSNS